MLDTMIYTDMERRNTMNRDSCDNTENIVSVKNVIKHRITKNLIFAVTCAIFAAIYEYFSHQVYSMFMICAFLFPVILGILPDLFRSRIYDNNGNTELAQKPQRKMPDIALTLQQCGIYTFTIGSIFKGVLDIYGTTNSKGVIYWWCGGVLFAAGIVAELLHYCKSKKLLLN